MPNGWRTTIFDVGWKNEPPFSNAMHQFDAGNGNGSITEPFESEHDVGPGFDVSVILLDSVVQVFRGSKFGVIRQQAVRLHLAHSTMRRGVAIQCDAVWRSALACDRFLEESLGRSDVSLGAESEVHGVACVNCTGNRGGWLV